MNKNIIVTGASRGIGCAIALEYSKHQNNILIMCQKNTKELEQVKEQIIANGSNCQTYTGDVSSYNSVAEMFDLMHQTFGTVDILINNAGISIVGLFQDMDRQQWEQMINTNLGSVYNCCHFAVPDMIHAKSGKIINISSVWGVVGASCEVAYSATKGAINSMTKALAKELAPSNIQVNAIACGAIDTDMNHFLSDEDREMLIEEIPAGRMGTGADVARLAYDLTTGNEYLTGQIIQLDGAWI